MQHMIVQRELQPPGRIRCQKTLRRCNSHVKRQKAMENTHSLDRFGFTKASDPICDQVSHFCYDLLDFVDALFVCVIVSSHPC